MLVIECTLHGSLEDFLADSSDRSRTQLEFPTAPSVCDILEKLKIPTDSVQFALADGLYIEFEHWREPASGSSFQFWPRISGG